MSSQPTQFSEQAILNYSTDNTVSPPLLTFGMMYWNGTAYVRYGSASSIGDGSKNVTTAGTRVQLSSSSVPCSSVTITAKAANTGIIVVGGATVVASASTRQGVPLEALDSINIKISNLNLIYLDSTVSGEGVTYAYTA